jgi:threonine/homoserine/homoserine lactone efflux protein
MLELATTALILGLAAGLAPGPLLTLVVAETLRHGMGAGIRVALAPLITDVPLILVTLLVMSRLDDSDSGLGIVSLIGGAFLLLMAYESWHPPTVNGEPVVQRTRSLLKGVLANLLNPHPYLFWLGVGGPLLTKSIQLGLIAPLLFLGVFYLMLVGSKVLLAVLVGRSSALIGGRWRIYVFRLLGLLLFLLAMGLLRDGLVLLDVIGGARAA